MSFITVKYGAQEEKLFNPNCLCIVLLNHIRKACGYGNLNPPIVVDLASESGEVLDLVNKPKEVAKKYLEGRGTYILLKVVGEDSDESATGYVPLLDLQGTEKIKFSLSTNTRRTRRFQQPANQAGNVSSDKQTNLPGMNATGVNAHPEVDQTSLNVTAAGGPGAEIRSKKQSVVRLNSGKAGVNASTTKVTSNTKKKSGLPK